jgi:Holliday junction resolvasome RuvABC ATP-dependent DNA helicase subunit
MASSRSDIAAKLQDSSRIGTRLADQIRHQKEVIQSHVRERNQLMERFVKLELDYKTMEERNLRLVRYVGLI